MPYVAGRDLTQQYISSSFQYLLQIENGALYTGNGNTVDVALNASASYALTASYALNGGGGSIDTSSLVRNDQTSSMSVLSSSYAITASYALNSTTIDTSSFVTNSQTSSMTVLSASHATTASFAQSGEGNFSGAFTGDGSGLTGITATGTGVQIWDDGTLRGVAQVLDFTTNIDVSFANSTASISLVTSSYAQTASLANRALEADTLQGDGPEKFVFLDMTASMTVLSSSYAQTASYLIAFDKNDYVLNSLTSSMTVATASYVLQAVSASYATSANLLIGFNQNNYVQNTSTSSFVLNSQTASMTVLSSSYATSASLLIGFNQTNYVQNSSTSSFVTNAQTSSMTVATASWATRSISSSYATSASMLIGFNQTNYVQNSSTSSFVLNSQTSSMTVATASYVQYTNVANTPIIKAGIVNGSTFGGTPRTATVTFSTAFANNNYSVVVSGETARTWTIESKANASFVINSNSDINFTNDVFWQAIAIGEY